jgi:hypothetical protein
MTFKHVALALVVGLAGCYSAEASMPDMAGAFVLDWQTFRGKSMKYACSRGHRWESRAPLTITFQIDYAKSTAPLLICPFCLEKTMDEKFGAYLVEGQR